MQRTGQRVFFFSKLDIFSGGGPTLPAGDPRNRGNADVKKPGQRLVVPYPVLQAM